MWKKPLIIFLFMLYSINTTLSSDFKFSMNIVDVGGSNIPIYIYKPIGLGPFPLIVLSHGSPRRSEDRSSFDRNTFRDQAIYFVRHGAVVAVPIRRGYGDNSNFVEFYQMDCSHPNYYDAGREGAKDITSALNSLASDHDIDLGRVVLVGHSAGGFASVAAGATQKVLGVISFAGGRGSNAPGKVTCEQQLISAVNIFGKTSPEKELWLYSKNDQFFSPDIANELHTAFNNGGGHAKLVIVPPYSNDGHLYFYKTDLWSKQVSDFLDNIGFYR